MKRYWKKATALFLTLALLTAVFAISAAAVTSRSSYYLSCYRAWLTPEDGGVVDVTIDVQAVDDMDYVGSTKVEMYESSDGGTSWHRDGTYLSALVDGMLVEDDYMYFDTPISHQGTPGYKYYAVVTVYAEDHTGSDSKTYVTQTVMARR